MSSKKTPDQASVLSVGDLDPSFGDQGAVIIPHPDDASRNLFPDFMLSDTSGSVSKIYACSDETGELNGRAFLVRLLADGQLDDGFGVNGYCELPNLPEKLILGFVCYGLIFSESGKMLTLLGAKEDWRTFRLVSVAYRITVEGVLDNTFGQNGMVLLDFPVPQGAQAPVKTLSRHGFLSKELSLWSRNAHEIRAFQGGASSSRGQARVMADGKVLLMAKGESASFLVRINVDGSLDTSFGDSGTVLVTDGVGTVPRLMECETFVADEQGRITVAGRAGNSWSIIRRYDHNGQPDEAFGPGGFIPPGTVHLYFASRSCRIRDMKLVGGELVILCGLMTSVVNEQVFGLVRLLDNGEADPKWNNGQPVIGDYSPYAYVGVGVDIDDAGRIIVVGYRAFVEEENFYLQALMSRYFSSGMPDEAFGPDGHRPYEQASQFRVVSPQGPAHFLILMSGNGLIRIGRFIG